MGNGPPRIFDRLAYRTRRARAELARGDLFLAQETAGHVAERLGVINRSFARGLDLQSRARVFPSVKPLAQDWVRTGFPADAPDVIADEEALPFAEASFDLVTSILSLHAVNDLPGALVQIRRTLKPDGVFMGALFGGDTLQELKQAFASAESEILGGISPRVAPFGDVRELGGLLQRTGFTLPVADVERMTIGYRGLARLFTDLRSLGETNILAGRHSGLLSRRLLKALTADYAAHFCDDEGRFTATFDIIFLTGWAPHESQQKPLQPGSAKARLAEALGTNEQPTGEKPEP